MNEAVRADPITHPPSDVHGQEVAMWVPPPTEELQQLLPQFAVLELIGHGGMGAVYKARQLSLDRLVAIKLLPLHALDNGNSDYVERFKNEARLMARMNHPDIVTVHDFGETSDGHLYFIMEFVDGTDVSKMIGSQGRLPPEYALAITAHVCDALQYAHAHGVIHRDIKPGNVLINMEGEVKVADFGIANAGVAHLGGVAEGNVTLGTPDYIAPEALMIGVEVDCRADLYSIGVMLYHMLTGALPQGEFQPASQLAGSDVRYDAIIERALRADRELRYQSAREIRRDLDEIIITPAVKEGDVTGKAALPKQLVHRRVIQAPVFRRPVASHYNFQPVPKKYSAPLWSVGIVIVLAAGAYVWRNELQSMLSAAGYHPESKAKSREATVGQQHSPAAWKKAPSMFDVTEAFKPPTGSEKSLVKKNLGKVGLSTSPSPVSGGASSDFANAGGTWMVVRGPQEASAGNKMKNWGDDWVTIESNSVRVGPVCRDGAIRATIDVKPASSSACVFLRRGKDGSRYALNLNSANKAEISLWNPGSERGEVLKEVKVDISSKKKNYTLEFRAIGTKLIGLVNGAGLISVEDRTLSSGSSGIEAKNKAKFRDIAVLNLDHTKSFRDLTGTPGNPGLITDPRLSQIEAQFQQAYDRDIFRAHEASVSDLDAKYAAAIDRAETAAIKAGKSDEALQLQKEKLRAQNKQPILSTGVEPVPASLKQLRATYADALAKIDHDSDLKSRSCYDELDRQMHLIEKSLIEERRTDDAQLVKAKRDQIADKISRH